MIEVHRILAPNPGLYTGSGTNTYVITSQDECLIVDPGPIISEHRAAITNAVAALQPQAVLVTHTHPDHAPLANPLAAGLGVPALGFAPGPEFEPDGTLTDGSRVPFGRTRAQVLFTPGHSGDHVCFAVDEVLFTGDHIMGGSTVVIEDLSAYLRSLRRLQSLDWTKLYPGHGPEIDDAPSLIQEYIDHRLEREQQIVAALDDGAATVGEIVERVYADVDPALHPVAAHSVAAHLAKLVDDGVVGFTRRRYDHGEPGLWEEPVTTRAGS